MRSSSTQLDNSAKQQRLEALLERAAEDLEDLNPRVLAEYYRRYPGARQAFLQNGLSQSRQLEEDMVNAALYCLMTWFARPIEIEIAMGDSVPQHQFRNIPIEYVTGLQEVVCDVIAESVPDLDDPSKVLLEELKQSLVNVFRDAVYTPGA